MLASAAAATLLTSCCCPARLAHFPRLTSWSTLQRRRQQRLPVVQPITDPERSHVSCASRAAARRPWAAVRLCPHLPPAEQVALSRWKRAREAWSLPVSPLSRTRTPSIASPLLLGPRSVGMRAERIGSLHSLDQGVSLHTSTARRGESASGSCQCTTAVQCGCDG